MKKILAFGGSTSSTSINKQLASYTANLVTNTIVEVIDLTEYLAPVYSTDEEKKGFPEKLLNLSQHMKKFDGYIVSLAEHNGSYAAAFKSILDWLSRINREIFNNHPVLLLATSPGGRGGASVLETASNYFPHAGARDVITFSLSNFYDNFQENKIVNDEILKELLSKVHTFSKKLK
jgi:NAD(P)H-dependent FMN reductase